MFIPETLKNGEKIRNNTLLKGKEITFFGSLHLRANGIQPPCKKTMKNYFNLILILDHLLSGGFI